MWANIIGITHLITGITSPRLRRDVRTDETAFTSYTRPLAESTPTTSIPEVQPVTPVSATRSDLIKGLHITDQRLLLNQYQALNETLQALLLRQPTLHSVIKQQLARSFGTTPPVDASSVYVHRYDTDEQGQRTLISGECITEALFNALRKLKTQADEEASARDAAAEVGFYTSASPSESSRELRTHDTLLSMAQAIEKELPLSLTRFWTEPRTGEPNPESPQTVLLNLHREMLATLAALGVEDGALTPAAKTLIDKALEYPILAARESAMKDAERPGVYPLKLDTPSPDGSLLAGAFLITSSDGSSATRPFNNVQTDRTLLPAQQQGLTVLYTPRDGYETFDSPGKALAALRQRISEVPDAAEQLLQSLPIAVQQGLKGDWKNQLNQNLAPVAGDVVAAGMPQLLERQRQQVSDQLRALYESEEPEPLLVDPWRHLLTEAGLHEAADLGAHFDGNNVLLTRAQWLDSRADAIDARQALDQRLGDQENWRYLAQKLNEAAQTLPDTPTERDVSAMLKKMPMNIAPQSAHYQTYVRAPGKSVTLEAFISETGLPLPKTADDLLALAQTAKARAQRHPFGNFAGGLSWPIPLDIDQQNTLRLAAVEYSHSAADLPQAIPKRGVLENLGTNLSVADQALQDPVKVIETLISSREGQALGRALQTKMDGIPTKSSANDYALAAIQLLLDPESLTAPQRNHVAGYDLANKRHWGKPLSSIADSLRQHLIDTGREPPEFAHAAAHLLLRRTAPQLLVKNIPDSVVYGSTAWANLCIAVAAIEAKTPGRTATMSFAEVMITADTAGAASASAQAAVMLDWGVANNILPAQDDALYQPDDLTKAQALFKAQLDKSIEASSLIGGSFPSRKQMALDLLLKTFGPGIDFELKMFSRYNGDMPGAPRSLVEIAMQEQVMDGRWILTWANTGVNLDAVIAFTKGPQFNIQRAFEDAFTTALNNHKTVKKNAIINALTNLPPEDRKNLTQGKLNYFQEKSYKVGMIPFEGDSLFHTSPTVLVTAQNKGQTTTYQVDTVNGVIKSLGSRKTPAAPLKFSNEIIKEEPFYPDRERVKVVDGGQSALASIPLNSVRVSWFDLDGLKESALDREQPSTAPQPYMFLNPRTQHIADSVLKALDLDNPAIKQAAAGTTTLERNHERLTNIKEFVLNLIPLRSAIVNAMDGNYGEAISDVTLDIFGLVTAGAGMAARIGKVLGAAGSATSKALKASKIMVPVLLKELNPLNGVGDLLKGAGKLTYQSAEAVAGAIGSPKGNASREALISAASRYESAATGTFKVGEQTVQGAAIKHNGKWYAFDEMTRTPYGPPKAFDPQHTFSPQSPKPTDTHAPRERSKQRPRPYDINGRVAAKPAGTPVPAGDYVKETKGKLVASHFKRDSAIKEEVMAKFDKEMNEHYDLLDKTGIAPRTIPAVDDIESVPNLFEKAFKVSQGVVLGESHDQMASFKLLYQQVETLKRQGVKKVYFEGLIDMPQGLVPDGIHEVGRSGKLRTEPSFEQLKRKLEENGISVLPIDHYYLTRHKDTRTRLRAGDPGYDSVGRLKQMNYFASQTILANSPDEKWVALVGHSHMNTCEGVPGLAELTKSISIGVFDNPSVRVPYGLKGNDPDRFPNPQTPLRPDDLPGDLQIYVGK